jgi:hypothetical protein
MKGAENVRIKILGNTRPDTPADKSRQKWKIAES